MPPKAVKERREKAAKERAGKEAKEIEKKKRAEAKEKRAEKRAKAKAKRKAVEAGVEEEEEQQEEVEQGFAKEAKKITNLGGKDKGEKLSIIIDKTEPPPITELSEEILESFTRDGMNIYSQKWPVFVDFSHKLWKLNKLDHIENINPLAVKEIDLSDNTLSKITNEPLNAFQKLRRLKIRNNFLREFELNEAAKLVCLDLHRNRLGVIPVLSALGSLQYLDLSFNKLEDGWDHLGACRKLAYLYLNNNLFEWDQDDFNDNVLKLHDLKALVDLNLAENPFRSQVRQYKEWILTNCPTLKRLDGEVLEKAEKKVKLKEAPLDIDLDDNDSNAEEQNDYDGPVCLHRMVDMTQVLKDCFDKPAIAIRAVREVEGRIEDLLETPEEGRMLFDSKNMKDKMASVVNLVEAFLQEEDNNDDQTKDPRDPPEIIDEFVMTVDLMLVRQPVLARKSMTLLAQLTAIRNENINTICQDKLLEYLNAGDLYANIVVDVIRSYIIPRMQGKTINEEERGLLLNTMDRVSAHPSVIESLRGMTNEIAMWMRAESPSVSLLNVVSNATTDEKIAQDLKEQQFAGRVIQVREKIDLEPDQEKRKAIMRIVGHLAAHDKEYAKEFRMAKLHHDALQELNNLLATSEYWDQDQTSRAEALITAVYGMTLNDEVALEEAQTNGYIERLLTVAERTNLHPRLMGTVLKAVSGIVRVIPSLTIVTVKLRGVTWLLPFLQGKGYNQMCRMTHTLVDGQPAPIENLANEDIINALVSILELITAYHYRAKNGDVEAKHTVVKMDNAGREDYLFRLLACTNDTVRLAVVECLNWVPLDNLQADEVRRLVEMMSGIDNLGVGQTEEVVAGVLRLLGQLALDQTPAGFEFRSAQVDVLHVVLDILVRNCQRDTRGSRQESEEKASLSEACIDFLVCASKRHWTAALDIMMTRNAVLAMGEILSSEETLGRTDRPVMIEKTGIGRGVKALLFALPSLKINGPVAKRVLLRIAEVLEGIEESKNVEDALIPKKFDRVAEEEEVKQWRLSQHSVFVQVEGVEVLLKYLLKDSPINLSQFVTSGVADRFQKLLKEEEDKALSKLLGEHLGDNSVMTTVKADGMAFLLREELHQPKLVDFPVETIGSLFGSSRRKRGGDATQSFDSAPAVAASLRVFCALLMHGSSSTKSKAIKKTRDVQFIQALVSLSGEITQFQWHPSGVGDNLLTIFDFLFHMDHHKTTESAEIIPLYDIASQVFRSMLRVVEPHLQKILTDYVVTGKTALRLQPEEEGLLQKLSATMRTMMFALQYIMPSDNFEINETVQDNLAMDIIDTWMLHAMLKYIYYDYVVGRMTWGKGDIEGADARVDTQVQINDFICEYLHVNDAYRFDILEFFNRMEVQHHLIIRQSYVAHMLRTVKSRTYLHNLERYMVEKNMVPEGFERVVLCRWLLVDTHKDTILQQTMAVTGLREPQPPLEDVDPKKKKNKTKEEEQEELEEKRLQKEEEEEMMEAEETLMEETLKNVGISIRPQDDPYFKRPKHLGFPNPKTRLFVISNLAYYLLQGPTGTQCTVCDESAFCPTGPTMLVRKEFRSTRRIVLHPTNQRLRLWVSSKDPEGKPILRVLTYATLELGVLDTLAQTLVDFYPLQTSADKPRVLPDEFTAKIFDNSMNPEPVGGRSRVVADPDSEEKKSDEKVLGSIVCWEGDFTSEDSHYHPHERRDCELLVTVTSLKIYFYKEDIEWWLVEEQEDKYLRLVSSFPLPKVETVRFSSSPVPAVGMTIRKGDDATQEMALTFADDPGRERFRVMLKKALDISQYTREYKDPEEPAEVVDESEEA